MQWAVVMTTTMEMMKTTQGMQVVGVDAHSAPSCFPSLHVQPRPLLLHYHCH